MVIVIYPPTIDWDWIKQRPQQLMEQFAKDGHEVYYCNKTQEFARPMSQPMPNVSIVHDNRSFLRSDIPRMKRQGKKIMVWATCPKHYIFLEQYFPDLIVHDYFDDSPLWTPYLGKMLDTADLAFASEHALKEQIEEANPLLRCELVPNGVSPEPFRPAAPDAEPLPEDFPPGEGPVIGYVGAWAPGIDQSLIERIAERFPEARIVRIGPEFGPTANLLSSNIHDLGWKPQDVLRRYVSRFDAYILPLSTSDKAPKSDPVKVYEYLADGKPVVTTGLRETRGAPHVYHAATHDEFIDHLRRVLSPGFRFDPERVNVWLSAHTWRRRYESIRATLAEQFPEMFANIDKAPADASELTLLIDRVRRKIELAAEAEPYIVATYLKNLEGTLASLLRHKTVELHESHRRKRDA